MVGMNFLSSDILHSYPIYLDLLITNCYIYYWDSHLTDRFLIVPYFFSIWIAMTLTQAGGDHLNNAGRSVWRQKWSPWRPNNKNLTSAFPGSFPSLFSPTSLLFYLSSLLYYLFPTSLLISTTSFLPLFSTLLPLSYLSSLLSYLSTLLSYLSYLLYSLTYLSSLLFSPNTPPLSILS